MSRIRSFVGDAVSLEAVVLVDIDADSTGRYIFNGMSVGVAASFLDATALEWKGYVGGDNVLSSGGAPDGYIECVPRRALVGNYACTTDLPPTGCNGTPFLGGFGPKTTLTTAGGINAAYTGAVTVNNVNAEWWQDGTAGIIQFLDTGEVCLCSNKAGTTLTISTRAQYGTTAAIHAEDAEVLCLASGTNGTGPWLVWLHGLLGAAATYNNSNAGIQVKNTSPIGTQGSLEVIWFGENPAAGPVVGAQIRLSIYSVDHPSDATNTIRTQIVQGSTVNPTTADAVGTMLATSVIAPAGNRPSNNSPINQGGVWADNHSVIATTGNYLGVRKILHSRTRKGGLIQATNATQGGKTLLELVSCEMRTPRWKGSQVRKIQAVRFVSSSIKGGSGHFRRIKIVGFGHNCCVASRLAFVVPDFSWTIDTSKTTTLTAAYLADDTTWNVGDTTNLPTDGHGYNATTGHRFSWTGKTATTLTGVVNGDYGTTAAPSAGDDDTLHFSYEHHTPLGFASTMAMKLVLEREYHNNADISQANATYPFATSGSFSMLAEDTGVPSASSEMLLLFVAPLPTSSSPVYSAGTVSTRHEREGRHRLYVATCQRYLGNEPDFAVLDPRTVTTVEELLASGDCTYLTSDTTLSAILNTGDATASLAATVASAAGTDNYMSVDGEIIEFSGISGAGPYTYTLRTRNITAQDGNLTTHASGTKVGFFDLIHHNPRAYTRVFTETLRQATNPGSLAALPHWQQSPSLA